MKADPSPVTMTRAEKQRLKAVEGAENREFYEQREIAIRSNMERLKALRLAKKAEAALSPKSLADKPKKRTPKRKSDSSLMS
jgi:hypothetical protein